MGRYIPRTFARVGAIAIVLMLLSPSAQAFELRQDNTSSSSVAASAAVSSEALYNGEVVDMGSDWEGAHTCVVIPEHLALAECFDTDAERDERLDDLGLSHLFDETKAPQGASFATSYCSSYLKLYNGYWYSGSSVWLSARGFWMNLSQYNFNQRASSYKVGGCSTYMADYRNGRGAWIATYRTQRWDVDAVISGSWNNDISSIYIT